MLMTKKSDLKKQNGRWAIRTPDLSEAEVNANGTR